MQLHSKISVLTLAALTSICHMGSALADDYDRAEQHDHHVRISDFRLPLDVVNFSGMKADGSPYDTTLHFTVGIGSGAFHYPGDPATTIYTISDRGVNIKCSDDTKIIGADICPDGKLFPVPTYTPSIYKFEHRRHHGWNLVETIKLKNAKGHAITGLPNPLLATDTESAYDLNGAPIPLDPAGLDTEALLRLSDGTFWLADEYGPSLVHVAPGGEIIERLVPVTVAADLSAAGYPVSGILPDILKKRKLNRGIESIAVSPDERFLYFALQSPLANPNSGAYKHSRNVRLFKLDLASKAVVGEYVYQIDLPETFTADQADKQSKVKVSEMAAIGQDKLIVLERVSKTTKLYKVDLAADATDIHDSIWDDINTSPSLAQTDLNAAGIVPLTKHLVLDSAVDYPNTLPAKLEGLAILDGRTILMVNDNDFGIEGAITRFVTIRMDRDTLR